MGVKQNKYKMLVPRPEGKRHPEDLSVNGGIKLKLIFRL
jgi:hypothetical protein